MPTLMEWKGKGNTFLKQRRYLRALLCYMEGVRVFMSRYHGPPNLPKKDEVEALAALYLNASLAALKYGGLDREVVQIFSTDWHV